MMQSITEIEMTDFKVAAPAVLTILAIPLTFSIAEGIGLGLILAALLAVMVADEAHRTPAARATLARALREFGALAHRLEPVGEYAGIRWINDSKATNVASTQVGVAGMTRPTVLLLGGRHKGEPYTTLAPELRRIARAVVAFGEAAHVRDFALAQRASAVVQHGQRFGGGVVHEVLPTARRWSWAWV
jgi:UDP-N-acetylmuramoylalanine--D-glutamate ligase